MTELDRVNSHDLIQTESVGDSFARELQNEAAADAAAMARAKLIAPRGEALQRLLKKFPVPQEWWDEED